LADLELTVFIILKYLIKFRRKEIETGRRKNTYYNLPLYKEMTRLESLALIELFGSMRI
jgi:hypothetical protein